MLSAKGCRIFATTGPGGAQVAWFFNLFADITLSFQRGGCGNSSKEI